MVRDPGGRGLLAVAVAAVVCCGAAVLLVTAGVLSVGGGLLGSPELTVAAVVVGLLALWRVVVALVRMRN